MKHRFFVLVPVCLIVVGCAFVASALACATKSIHVAQRCDTTSGKVTVTFTALVGAAGDHANWYTTAPGPVSGGGPGGVLPSDGSGVLTVTLPAGFKGTVTRWEQATAGERHGNTLMASTVVSGSCQPPVRVHYAPRARFEGPCGDPYYRAVFNNRHSNAAVRFSFRYFSFASMNYQHVRLTVRAHGRRVTRYVHVLGGSRLAVYAAHKGLIAHKQAAAPGNYGACA